MQLTSMSSTIVCLSLNACLMSVGCIPLFRQSLFRQPLFRHPVFRQQESGLRHNWCFRRPCRRMASAERRHRPIPGTRFQGQCPIRDVFGISVSKWSILMNFASDITESECNTLSLKIQMYTVSGS